MRALVATVFLLLFTAGAVAQSCGSLRSQLAAAKAGRPNQAVVASIERKSRSYCCQKRGRGRHYACAGIDRQLRQAKAGGVNQKRVRRLRNQINTHCGKQKSWSEAFRRGPRREAKGNRRSGGGFLSKLFGGGRGNEVETARVDPGAARSSRGVERVNLDTRRHASSGKSRRDSYGTLATRSRSHAKGSTRVGNSRTMCVRLCDGFYFPINNRSHSDNYYDELAACVGRCPGADVSLYVHSNGQAVEQMRSTMTGEAYVHLPTAFAYRKKLSPSCSCANGTQIVRGGDTAPRTSLASASINDGAKSDSKDESRWTPYRAVYDETGKTLSPSLTSHGAIPATTGTEPPVELATLPRPTPTGDDDTATRTFDPRDNSARQVGPQFFTQAVAEFANRKERVKPDTSGARQPTIITVTPLPGRGERAASEVPLPATRGSDATVDDIAPGTSAMIRKTAGSGG